MFFEKDNTETINEVSANLSAFLQDIVTFVKNFIDFLNQYFSDEGELA